MILDAHAWAWGISGGLFGNKDGCKTLIQVHTWDVLAEVITSQTGLSFKHYEIKSTISFKKFRKVGTLCHTPFYNLTNPLKYIKDFVKLKRVFN